jgi:hypothetical protein
MTQVEFDTAVVTLGRNGRASIRTEYEERVFVSAYQMMRQRLNIPDNEHWEGPNDHELASGSVNSSLTLRASARDCANRK